VTIRHSLIRRLAMSALILGAGVWTMADTVRRSISVAGDMAFGLVAAGLVLLAYRLANASIRLDDERIVLRGILRTRAIPRAEVVGVHAKPVKASLLATLELRDGAEVDLPLAAQGNLAHTRLLTTQLEEWIRRN
jgi:hypothetical protein